MIEAILRKIKGVTIVRHAARTLSLTILFGIMPAWARSETGNVPPLIDWKNAAETPYGLDVGQAGKLQPVAKIQSNLADVYQFQYMIRFGEKDVPAYRTFVSVGGKNSYLLMLEDYPEFAEPGLFERPLGLASGASLGGYVYDKGGDDVILKGADGSEEIIRVLEKSADLNARLPAGLRTGGPAMITTGQNGKKNLVIPAFTARPRFRVMSLKNRENLPESKWLDGGRVLRVEWHDQVDEFTFETDENGRTRMLLERKRGEFSDEVLSFGIRYVPPVRTTGNLIGYWSFDAVNGGVAKDESGRGHHARIEGGVRVMPGIRGLGIDGVSCEGVGPGELVLPTVEGVLPGKLSTGVLRIPGGVLAGVSNRMSISYWYAIPPRINGGYLPYLPFWNANKDRAILESTGLKIYSYDHFLGGQKITAAALAHQRLFGMIGPQMELDMWNHYVITLDGLEGRLYINGELRVKEGGKKLLSETLDGTAELLAMKDVWARMDELRIFDYALDEDSIRLLYKMEGHERLVRLDFDRDPPGKIAEGRVTDVSGVPCKAEHVEIIARDGGRALRFGEGGGSVKIAPALTWGKPMEVVTFAAWVRLPNEVFRRRCHLLGSGNHGHVGIFAGFNNGGMWGQASLNAFSGGDVKLVPGEWAHVVWSYGHNRIQTWINGRKVQDNPEAYPGPKGWGVGDFTIGYDSPLEIDDVQLFNFSPTDEQIRALFAGKDVVRPVTDMKKVAESKKVYTAE